MALRDNYDHPEAERQAAELIDNATAKQINGDYASAQTDMCKALGILEESLEAYPDDS